MFKIEVLDDISYAGKPFFQIQILVIEGVRWVYLSTIDNQSYREIFLPKDLHSSKASLKLFWSSKSNLENSVEYQSIIEAIKRQISDVERGDLKLHDAFFIYPVEWERWRIGTPKQISHVLKSIEYQQQLKIIRGE